MTLGALACMGQLTRTSDSLAPEYEKRLSISCQSTSGQIFLGGQPELNASKYHCLTLRH
jgi:hypothetical protein